MAVARSRAGLVQRSQAAIKLLAFVGGDMCIFFLSWKTCGKFLCGVCQLWSFPSCLIHSSFYFVTQSSKTVPGWLCWLPYRLSQTFWIKDVCVCCHWKTEQGSICQLDHCVILALGKRRRSKKGRYQFMCVHRLSTIFHFHQEHILLFFSYLSAPAMDLSACIWQR